MLERIKEIDEKVLDNISAIHNPVLNFIMRFFSLIGNMGLVWFAITVPLYMFKSTRLTAINMVIGISITHVMGEILIKHLVCRERPCHKLEDERLIVDRPKYYSFPSGHTASSFSIVAITLLRCPMKIWLPILILACLIGFSRVYLMVHYLTDVMVGMALGLVCGSSSVALTNYIFFDLAKRLAKDPSQFSESVELALDSPQIAAVLVVYSVILVVGISLLIFFKKKSKKK